MVNKIIQVYDILFRDTKNFTKDTSDNALHTSHPNEFLFRKNDKDDHSHKKALPILPEILKIMTALAHEQGTFNTRGIVNGTGNVIKKAIKNNDYDTEAFTTQ